MSETPKQYAIPILENKEVSDLIAALGLDPRTTGDLNLTITYPNAGIAVCHMRVSVFMTEEQMKAVNALVLARETAKRIDINLPYVTGRK